MQSEPQSLIPGKQVAAGFFLGGSSIKDMNGVYKRVKWVNNAIEHEVMGAYRKYDYGKEDDGHGWVIAYIKSPKPGSGIEPVDPGYPTEWVIIDPSNHDRFGHLGETRTPLSGRSWKHLHRKTSPQTQGTNEVMAPDDERELPWQLVFIGSPQTVEERRKEHLQHRAEQEAAFGRDWSTVQGGMGNAEEDKNGGIEAVPDAETAFEEKRCCWSPPRNFSNLVCGKPQSLSHTHLSVSIFLSTFPFISLQFP